MIISDSANSSTNKIVESYGTLWREIIRAAAQEAVDAAFREKEALAAKNYEVLVSNLEKVIAERNRLEEALIMAKKQIDELVNAVMDRGMH